MLRGGAGRGMVFRSLRVPGTVLMGTLRQADSGMRASTLVRLRSVSKLLSMDMPGGRGPTLVLDVLITIFETFR